MRLHRGLPPPGTVAPLALTIGTFDGVHRGHQAMLARVIEAADDLGLAPAALTFEPHPREFFAPASAPPRLFRLRAKLEQLAANGMAHVFVARFDARLASLTAAEFIEHVLVERLNVRWVLVGDDFRFGKGRAGTTEVLRRAARTFSVEAMATVSIDGERVSSSAIRDALGSGDLARATALLGRPYAVTGRVAHGAKLGRSIGIPTANIPLRQRPPLMGVFAVRVHGVSATPLPGVASIGVRPTVYPDGPAVLEVFIFDFEQEIYGRRVQVELVQKLRDEERYPDLDTLRRQMGVDIAQARAVLAAG